ncbi:Protein of unknown function [Amycolatopsis saalfeldensis]|uniref:Uncharacterized protein n=1 Tax=Amycolatopsis saalfeldensis TaxID=394193 RepID=A0A1H8YQI6_9PSEU|nr:Protein of unknown function [Amycolatopsis saalfeldensis]
MAWLLLDRPAEPDGLRVLLLHRRASFAASDVEVQDRRIRCTVLTHGILSFSYNTAVLGIVIGVITGL